MYTILLPQLVGFTEKLLLKAQGHLHCVCSTFWIDVIFGLSITFECLEMSVAMMKHPHVVNF